MSEEPPLRRRVSGRPQYTEPSPPPPDPAYRAYPPRVRQPIGDWSGTRFFWVTTAAVGTALVLTYLLILVIVLLVHSATTPAVTVP